MLLPRPASGLKSEAGSGSLARKESSMKLEYGHNKDFWSGLMFMGTGAAAIFIARDYTFGTTLRMGPGYFPSMLGGILILFGMAIMAKGLRSNEKIKGHWSVRALIVLPLSLGLFGILMEKAGFLPAMVALVFGSAAAGREFKWGEVLLCTVVLTVLSVGIFIWGLGLPYSLMKGF
jgi:uncharacterized membrane protein